MQGLNGNTDYSGVSTLNHWLTALLVIAMWTLGLAAGGAPDAAAEYIMSLHIGLGFFVLWFVLWRTGWRLVNGFPRSKSESRFERIAAGTMHRALLVVLVALVVTGPMYLFTEGEGMNVFGWFTFYIPLPFGQEVHEAAEEVHKFCGEYMLPGLVGIHLLAAARQWLVPHRRGL